MLIGSWLPTQGSVRLDGAAISRWNRDQAGLHVGYMSQSVELFAGSVKENIARFKRPKRYVFVDALPKNHYGKVLKTELRARLGVPRQP